MSILFVEYPRCSACQRAKRWLEGHHVVFHDRHIVEQNPSETELTEWIGRSGLPVKRFFNTSGVLYKQLQLKDKLPDMNREEMIKLLASNGMLVKRPLIVAEDDVLVGFKEAEWEEKLR